MAHIFKILYKYNKEDESRSLDQFAYIVSQRIGFELIDKKLFIFLPQSTR